MHVILGYKTKIHGKGIQIRIHRHKRLSHQKPIMNRNAQFSYASSTFNVQVTMLQYKTRVHNTHVYVIIGGIYLTSTIHF